MIGLLAVSLGDVVDKVILFFTVASFGALFLVYGTTKTLRDTNADLRAQHDDDKERLAQRGIEIAELKKVQAELQGRIAVLEGLVTGAVNWTAISDQLDMLHKEAVRHWQRSSKDSATLTEIRAELHGLTHLLTPREPK